MKICVIGNGILARDFRRLEYEVIDCDFRDFKIEFVLDYDVIINTYDCDQGDKSAEKIMAMKKCNIDLPLLISEFCSTRNKRFVQVSTGKLYSSCDAATEITKICANTAYTATKLLAELGCHKKDLIIRTSNLFNDAPSGENALFRAITNTTPSKNLESYTWTVDAIRGIVALLKSKVHGTVNITSTGLTSQAEICKDVGIIEMAPTFDQERADYKMMNIDKLTRHIIPMDVDVNIKKCFELLKKDLED